MAASSYATTTDLATYLQDANATANATIWTTLLASASRLIDLKTGQYFYADGQSTKYFDGGFDSVDTGGHPFYGKGGTIGAVSVGATSLTYTKTYGPAPISGDVLVLDVGTLQETVTINGAVTGTGPYTCPVTATAFAHGAKTLATTIQLQLAYYENQPLAQWTAVFSGDGHTPPSNYFMWPRNPKNAGSSADATAWRPWNSIDIAHIPVAATSFLPSTLPGYLMASLTAFWGWPVVPDDIKNMTLKIAARAWRARSTGWTTVIGSPELGAVVDVSKFFDQQDYMILKGSDYCIWSQG